MHSEDPPTPDQAIASYEDGPGDGAWIDEVPVVVKAIDVELPLERQ